MTTIMTMTLKHRNQLLAILCNFFRLLKWQGIQLGLWIGLLGYKCLFIYLRVMNQSCPMLSQCLHLTTRCLGVNRSNQGIGKRPFPGPCTAFISGPGFRSVSQAPKHLVPGKLIAGCFEGDPLMEIIKQSRLKNPEWLLEHQFWLTQNRTSIFIPKGAGEVIYLWVSIGTSLDGTTEGLWQLRKNLEIHHRGFDVCVVMATQYES